MNENNYFLAKIYFFYLIYCYYDFRILFDIFLINIFINLINISNIGFHNNILYFLLKCFVNLLSYIYSYYEEYLTKCIKSNIITCNIYILYLKLNNLLLLIFNKIYDKTITILFNKLTTKNKLDTTKNLVEIEKLNTNEEINSFLDKIN